VLADSVYANSPEFVEAVESLVGVTYLLRVPEDTLCWLKNPGTITKTYKYKCKVRTKKIVSDQAWEPISIKTLAAGINDFFWYRRKVTEGAKGPIEYEFTERRVVLSFQGIPHKTVWLLVWRTIGEESQYSCFLSNAPASI